MESSRHHSFSRKVLIQRLRSWKRNLLWDTPLRTCCRFHSRWRSRDHHPYQNDPSMVYSSQGTTTFRQFLRALSTNWKTFSCACRRLMHSWCGFAQWEQDHVYRGSLRNYAERPLLILSRASPWDKFFNNSALDNHNDHEFQARCRRLTLRSPSYNHWLLHSSLSLSFQSRWRD